MRQLLRRLAVTAVLAPVAALGATAMITEPAQAAPAKPGPTQPGWWISGPSHPGFWFPGQPLPGNWKPGPTWPGPSWPAPTKPTPTKPAPTKPAPVPTTPAPTKPAPTKPAPVPTTPAPTKPAPTTPAPTKPAPTTPAPTKPAPTTPAPTTPAPTKPAPTTPGTSADQTLENEVSRLVNAQRTGCAALTVNDKLTAAARDHSAWMARTRTMSHTGEGGSTFVTRAKAAGYAQPSAENIAYGYRTAKEVVDGWMSSSGHRTNIMNCQSKTAGVGVARAADGTVYYTQVFGY